MSDIMMNSPKDATSGTSKSGSAKSDVAGPIPVRRGSKYIDIVLQRLKLDVLSHNPAAVIGVAGVTQRQGVTTTAVNLAIRAADHRISPVLVIDGNYSNQKVSRLYRASGPGLTDCLAGTKALQSCTRKTKVANMNVLGLGQSATARQIVMGTDHIHDFFVNVRENYQLSVVDLPLIHELSLANAVLPHLDGVLLVAKYGTRKEQMAKLVDSIKDAGGKVLGVVMTGQESKLPGWLSRFF